MKVLAYLVALFLTCYFFGTGVATLQLALNSEPSLPEYSDDQPLRLKDY